MSNDNSWEQVARDIHEDFEKASTDWKPPAGNKYTCLFIGLKKEARVRDSDKKKYLQVQPRWRILDGQLDGTEWWGDRRTSLSEGSLGVMRSFLSKLNGEDMTDPVAAINAAEKLINSVVCEVEVVEKPGKKEGQKYINERVTQVLDTVNA